MTGNTHYLPIALIHTDEYKHLKDGRPVLVLTQEPNWRFPVLAEWYEGWMGWGWHVLPDALYKIEPTHFSTHDPRPAERKRPQPPAEWLDGLPDGEQWPWPGADPIT